MGGYKSAREEERRIEEEQRRIGEKNRIITDNIKSDLGHARFVWRSSDNRTYIDVTLLEDGTCEYSTAVTNGPFISDIVHEKTSEGSYTIVMHDDVMYLVCGTLEFELVFDDDDAIVAILADGYVSSNSEEMGTRTLKRLF